jgi:predicted DNA-binding protein (UPF0251 family)
MVEVPGTQSHTCQAIISLAQRRSEDAPRRATTKRQQQVRLSEADIERVVFEYREGAPTTKLARQFGVHRNTVQRLLKARGLVLIRGPCIAYGETTAGS